MVSCSCLNCFICFTISNLSPHTGRELSAIMLPSNEVIQVDAKSVYVVPDKD
jgi:hypothetical protein